MKQRPSAMSLSTQARQFGSSTSPPGRPVAKEENDRLLLTKAADNWMHYVVMNPGCRPIVVAGFFPPAHFFVATI
jgi:hypothetical protein